MINASDQIAELYLPPMNLVWIVLGSSVAAVLVGTGSYLLAAAVS